MAANDQGLKSEALQAALQDALRGKTTRFEDLLARHGDTLTPRPNLKLAAALGAELAAHKGNVMPLITRLGADDSAPDTAGVFLPIAAAHAWVALAGADREVETAWTAIFELAADERTPVRLGLLDALAILTARPGGTDALLLRVQTWLAAEDSEKRYLAIALAAEALGNAHARAGLEDHARQLDFFTGVLEQVADAPRSAARSPEFALLLKVLPLALSRVVASGNANETLPWFEDICRNANDPTLREVLSETMLGLRRRTNQSGGVIDDLRRTLEGSAKPLRHAARVRPGTGRGKHSRKIR